MGYLVIYLFMTQTGFTAQSKEISHLFDALDYFYPGKSMDVDLGERISALEEVFSQFEIGCKSFSTFIDGLVKSSVWQSWDYPDNPYRDLCLNLSNEVDDLNDKMITEPAYHSRRHFQDVCLSLTMLLMQDHTLLSSSHQHVKWHLDLESRWILLFCAIGHDFGHDGSTNHSPFELEKASIQRLDKFLLAQGCLPEFIQGFMRKVESIILSTDPDHYATLCDQLRAIDQNDDPVLSMSGLLVESDLLASILPKRGRQLSMRLGQEWSSSHPTLAKIVSSANGRLTFLNKLTFFSSQAHLLGLCDILTYERSNLKSALESHRE